MSQRRFSDKKRYAFRRAGQKLRNFSDTAKSATLFAGPDRNRRTFQTRQKARRFSPGRTEIVELFGPIFPDKIRRTFCPKHR
jgi:hypothetical protein